MKTYAVAAIPGDDIGPEVIGAGVEVLEAVARRDGGFAMARKRTNPPGARKSRASLAWKS